MINFDIKIISEHLYNLCIKSHNFFCINQSINTNLTKKNEWIHLITFTQQLLFFESTTSTIRMLIYFHTRRPWTFRNLCPSIKIEHFRIYRNTIFKLFSKSTHQPSSYRRESRKHYTCIENFRFLSFWDRSSVQYQTVQYGADEARKHANSN